MSNFKVVVVGGGPAGLTAAHALSRAEIDFVVLERRPAIVEDIGASLVLSPQTQRVLGQLGLLQSFREVGQEVLHHCGFNMQGKKFREGWNLRHLKEGNGAYPGVYHRADVTRLLYDALLPKHASQIHTNKKVEEIAHTAGGVCVKCADGSEYKGSIVLGADGVHSVARRLMHGMNLDMSKEAMVLQHPFSTEYKVVFCALPRLWEYAPGDFFVTHGTKTALQLLVARDRSWIFLYERLEKPKAKSEYVKYTEKDAEAFVAKYANTPVGNKYTMKDAWEMKLNYGMTDLEEGILEKWSSGRVVLVGDAAHKFTPNAGMGYNSGLQDVVDLVNRLHRCLKETEEPDDKELATLFKEYQDARIPTIQNDHTASALCTRLCAWPTWFFWVVDQYVQQYIPYFEHTWFKYVVTRDIAKGLVLDFVKAREPFVGRIPWVNPIPEESAKTGEWV